MRYVNFTKDTFYFNSIKVQLKQTTENENY